ncbi:MAG TPA: haloacid dehalogenase [Acidimicrobiia bacterium]|nr:haloacid dehalogenase [Acidimicrobiia bacterium]
MSAAGDRDAVVDRADEITALGERARQVLDVKHQARETTLGASRRAIQACAAAIRAVHRGEFDLARERIDEAAALLREADAAVDAHPDVRHGGYLHDAKKEFAEANLTLAFVRGGPMPTAADLGVEMPAYLNGMAEAASELRRHLLDCLRAGQLERAEGLLRVMDDVYGVLVTIDYPDALTGGLRRTTDALRAVIERSRGDLTTTLVASRLQATIDGLHDRTGA